MTFPVVHGNEFDLCRHKINTSRNQIQVFIGSVVYNIGGWNPTSIGLVKVIISLFNRNSQTT